MQQGLIATKNALATTVGTITLDSYTRVGDLAAVNAALRDNAPLNGYPIVNHARTTTLGMLESVRSNEFPVQVRHGSAKPLNIVVAIMAAQIEATEGGPISYCLPYGRVPLQDSVHNWTQCCGIFAQLRQSGAEPHLETFGGCMLGQLCPPSQLVAISVLEALFFRRNGLSSLSVSYAQQTHLEQDQEAILALRRLCFELLPDCDWHVVVYAYMGVFPASPEGARKLLDETVELAVTTQSERLIVKTAAEAHRIPTIEENVAALEYASEAADRYQQGRHVVSALDGDSQIYTEAYRLIDVVLNLHPDIGQAMLLAFERGYLDIPYCAHPDNAGRSRSYIDGDGRLRWADIGSLPIKRVADLCRFQRITSSELMETLSYVQRKFDCDAGRESGISSGTGST